MKRLRLIVGLGALLALAAPLAACTTDQANSAAVSMTSTSNSQQHALAAAQSAYTLLAEAATVYVQTAHPAAEVKAQIGAFNEKIYAALVTARAANAQGNSPAVAAGLHVLRTEVGGMKSYLAGLGLSLPDIPAIQ